MQIPGEIQKQMMEIIDRLFISTDEEGRAEFPESADPNTDDEWVPSICGMCASACPIRVHRVDGAVVKIEGNPTAHTRGKMCPKGNAGMMRMYDPNRIRTPLKRTNPEKGIGVDPRFVEISWDEALEIITSKLKEVRDTDPRNLLIGSMDFHRIPFLHFWALAYGCPVAPGAGVPGGPNCGDGQHMYGAVVHNAFLEFADASLTKMLLVVGAGAGHEAYHALSADAQKIAQARVDGMKMVVVDPRMSAAAAKATEWVPIRPGTDTALVLGMVNVLLNDLGIYDAEFLKVHTNGPYLVGPDGHYVRDKASGKPLVWDAADGSAKSHDDPSVQDFALEGTYTIDGVESRPGFQLLKDHVKKYSPEHVEDITSVPKDTVRRLAKAWGEAASIGTTIRIEGKSYPYRPVAVLFYRGHQAHKHATLDTMAMYILSMVVGAFDVPGGQLRWDFIGASHPGFPSCRVLMPGLPPGKDGIVQNMATMLFHPPMPVGPTPQLKDMRDYFPLAFSTGEFCYFAAAEPERYGFTKGQQVFFFHQTNPVMSVGDPKLVEKALQNSYVIDCNILIDETAELADLVIPEPTYLERHLVQNVWSMNYAGIEAAYPALKEPLYGLPDFLETLTEVWDRLGLVRGEGGLNSWFNFFCTLQEPWALDLNTRYSWPEIIDRIMQSHCNSSGHNLQWFREHGHRTRLTTAEEKYQPWGSSRLLLYSEELLRTGEELSSGMESLQVQEKIGVQWDFSDYAALPDWKPGPIHTAPPQYDLFVINYKPVFFTFSNGAFNPYLMELAEDDPYALKLWINTAAAKKRGLKEGDTVWVESPAHRTQGVVTIAESIHPECVGIASTLGHWARHSIAKGKGMHFNALNPVNWEWVDFVSGALEGVTSRVKVYKA